jgi:hypothetical protein
MTAPRALNELQRLVKEIEGQLLAFASADARTEWNRFRESCASAATPRPEVFATAAADDLAVLVNKARRFREVILLA